MLSRLEAIDHEMPAPDDRDLAPAGADGLPTERSTGEILVGLSGAGESLSELEQDGGWRSDPELRRLRDRLLSRRDGLRRERDRNLTGTGSGYGDRRE